MSADLEPLVLTFMPSAGIMDIFLHTWLEITSFLSFTFFETGLSMDLRPVIYYVNQSSLELTEIGSASQVLGLKVCMTLPIQFY